jgi:nicotinamidase-related amidase
MGHPCLLDPGNTVLVAIDFQERLFPAVYEKERLLDRVVRLLRGASVLEIPVILTEQYPRGLGKTLPEIAGLLPGIGPIEKACFNCCDAAAFRAALEGVNRKQVLICGIEAHICVYQTAVALLRSGYEVQVAADCISSRDPENKAVSLTKMGALGILPTTMEMALFELLKVASGERFKQISQIVK